MPISITLGYFEKTILIHFNQKGIRPGTYSIKINEYSLRSSDHVQFLGIFFDYQLKFNVHIDYFRNKCSERLNILKFISGIKWGAEHSTLISLYKSLIRSHIDYGSFLFALKTNHLMLKLEKIQYTALRIALGYRNSTPTNIILGDTRLSMLQHRAKYLCNRFIMKNLSNSGSTLYNWFNRLHNSTTCSNLVRKSHYILPRQIERQLLKTEEITPLFIWIQFTLFNNIPWNRTGLSPQKCCGPELHVPCSPL